MYCSKCGQMLPDGMKYCTKCGSLLSESAPDVKPKDMTLGMAADAAGISDVEAADVPDVQPKTYMSEESVTNQLLREILQKLDESKRDLRSNQKYKVTDKPTINSESANIGGSITAYVLCALSVIYMTLIVYTSVITYTGDVLDLLQYIIPNLVICAVIWGLGLCVHHLHHIYHSQKDFYESHKTTTGFEELED